MAPRTTGILLVIFALGALVFQWLHLSVPFFKVPFLVGVAVGYTLCVLLVLVGGWLVLKKGKEWNISPQTLRRLQRFRAIGRGYASFLILLFLVLLAGMDTLLVGKRALIVHYHGKWYFPFVREVLPGKTFGFNYDAETDYRDLQKRCQKENQGDWVLMPPVPYAPSLDTPPIIETLEQRGDKLYRPGGKEIFNGTAYTVFKSTPTKKRQEFIFRGGVRQGDMRGWNEKGEQVEKGHYDNGQRTTYTDYTSGQAAALEPLAAPEFHTLRYPPSPPSSQLRHYLGTNSTGGDVLAMLFGGWQQALLAAVLYVTTVFVVGVLIGGALGYFGGAVDLLGLRLIEIWSVLPFLFVVMIISSVINPTLVVLVGIIAMFGWMGTTTYLRTATYREKARDYVAAARLQGASTLRIIFHHVLPNVIAILVTLAPFEVSNIIISLAALDFLGYGVPADQPSWGRMLQEGVDNFTYPWIVSSAFAAMTLVLVLVTFVGEAVREAFDPKKFTTYE